jgi:predicted nucleic acid-binding protein
LGRPTALGRSVRPAWQDITSGPTTVVSPALLAELGLALAYPKLRQLITQEDAEAFVAWLSRSASVARDPDAPPPVRSIDPDDDYLLTLAADQHAALVSGDRHLLALAGQLPVQTPAEFLAVVEGAEIERSELR